MSYASYPGWWFTLSWCCWLHEYFAKKNWKIKLLILQKEYIKVVSKLRPKKTNSFMVIQFLFFVWGVGGGGTMYLVCISIQCKMLFCLNNFPNKITITKKMFLKRRILAFQAWYYNIFHMVMQKVIVGVPTTFKHWNKAWDQMTLAQDNRIINLLKEQVYNSLNCSKINQFLLSSFATNS